MKTALVYDWFADGAGGGEKAFEAIYELFPSPIYTLLRSPNVIQGTRYEQEQIHTTFIQNLPRALRSYRSYLPLFPFAIEQLDLSSYDLILSCSHCVAKGVLTHADQIHLSYCYTPMRYAWDLYHQYLRESNLQKGLKAKIAQFFLHYIRLWDAQTTHRVDAFSAISHYVAKRIKKTYAREARVIYPPVATDFYTPGTQKEEYYLAASRFVPYKKIDLIVETFSTTPERKLLVIGDGPDRDKIKGKAGKNIEFLGYQSNDVLKSYLQRAKAFVFAAVEDFGILPVEAQSCGTPVIALARGALLETVKAGQTGVFFEEQTVASLRSALDRFESGSDLDPLFIRAHAEKFGKERFNREFRLWVDEECGRTREERRLCIS